MSLSHTTQAAVAVVVKIPVTPGARSAVMPTMLPAVTAPRVASAHVESRWQSAWLPLLMGSSALGLALWALVRTW
jgi:hypothetical protein